MIPQLILSELCPNSERRAAMGVDGEGGRGASINSVPQWLGLHN